MVAPGQNILLIAEPFLKDPNFARTVVYLCRHSDEGSFGFVLNKPFEYTLDELIQGFEGTQIPVYTGGPVQPDMVHYIHQYPDLIPGSFAISNDIHWGGDFDTVKRLIRSGSIDLRKIKFFIGYSGWESGQLDHEMEEKSWLTVTATRNLVFDVPPEQVWKSSIEHLGGDYKIMAHFPIDPQLN